MLDEVVGGRGGQRSADECSRPAAGGTPRGRNLSWDGVGLSRDLTPVQGLVDGCRFLRMFFSEQLSFLRLFRTGTDRSCPKDLVTEQ